MKCDRCWFCTHIGAGIYAPYPLKYCKRKGEYFIPFIGENRERQLDFRKESDLKIWHEVGCTIHPKTAEKAKNDYIKRLEAQEGANEDQNNNNRNRMHR